MRKLHALIFVALLPLAACGKNEPTPAPATGAAATPANTALGRKIQQAMAEASAKLATENMQVGDHEGNLPKAEISPQGDLLIDGEPVPVDATQRKLLLAHRANLLAVAQAGIAVGMQGADLGIEAATGALKSVFSGEGDEFGKEMEARGERIEAEADKICQRLPALFASQQAVAAALPAFKPYATMDQSDIDDCGKDGHHQMDAGSEPDTDTDAHEADHQNAAAEADAAAKGSSASKPKTE
jgi:hypothetical protein